MKSLTQFILVTILLAFSVSSSMAQDKEETIPEAGKINTTYDSAKNETTVSFQRLLITTSPSEQLFLSVDGTYATRTPKNHPEDIIFIISALSPKGYRYPDIMALTIVADGKQLPQVLMLNLDKRRTETDYLETIGTRMKYDIFIKVAQAKKVEMKLSETSFKLDEQQLQKLRELADLIHL
jgi:hypothetical protein